jgi:uncharacterized membrane protein YeaQ/YmgE (transglycosylase-associated protein family)
VRFGYRGLTEDLLLKSRKVTADLCSAARLLKTAEKQAGFISWIGVGLIGGYLASRVVNKIGEALSRNIIGIIGGIVGGVVFRALGAHGVTGPRALIARQHRGSSGRALVGNREIKAGGFSRVNMLSARMS